MQTFSTPLSSQAIDRRLSSFIGGEALITSATESSQLRGIVRQIELRDSCVVISFSEQARLIGTEWVSVDEGPYRASLGLFTLSTQKSTDGVGLSAQLESSILRTTIVFTPPSPSLVKG